MSPALPAALVAELSTLLGTEGWRMDDGALEANAQDNSWRHQRPAAVAFPADIEQVQALVRACRAHGVALVARGAGTGTTGAAVPQPGSIVLSFTRMDRIVEIRAGDRCAVVQPGVLNGTLQQALASHGLFWAPDPSSAEICSIGGNLACNAGGPRAVKYGTSRDNVLGLVAVTGTGEVIRCGGAYTKDATGYDLTHLLVGSEGTLALIVEATLKLTPLPVSQAGLRVLYRDVDRTPYLFTLRHCARRYDLELEIIHAGMGVVQCSGNFCSTTGVMNIGTAIDAATASETGRLARSLQIASKARWWKGKASRW